VDTVNVVKAYQTLQEGYAEICKAVLTHGELTSPRGQKTREILNPTIYIADPSSTLPVGIGRQCSLAVAAVEAVQLCGAFHDPELMVAAAPHFEEFREPYTRDMYGAYGRRISRQAHIAVRKLEWDRDSRQAVVTLWDPGLDNQPDKLDYPCTVSLQFLIRADKLLLTTNMRSNDAWLGLAYDLFQFSQLQWTVANMLGIEAGSLCHRPVSLHLYQRNWDDVEKLHPPTAEAPRVRGFRDLDRATAIGGGYADKILDLSSSEKWFASVLEAIER
jgi:thymidylate synthase